jgi:hypothetical protein
MCYGTKIENCPLPPTQPNTCLKDTESPSHRTHKKWYWLEKKEGKERMEKREGGGRRLNTQLKEKGVRVTERADHLEDPRGAAHSAAQPPTAT